MDDQLNNLQSKKVVQERKVTLEKLSDEEKEGLKRSGTVSDMSGLFLEGGITRESISAQMDAGEVVPLSEEKEKTDEVLQLKGDKNVSAMKSDAAVAGPSMKFRMRMGIGRVEDISAEQVEKSKKEMIRKLKKLKKLNRFGSVLDSLKELDSKGSDSYMEVKASFKYLHDKLAAFDEKNDDSFTTVVEALLRANEATRGYIETHRGTRLTVIGYEKKERIAAYSNKLNDLIANILCKPTVGVAPIDEPLTKKISAERSEIVEFKMAELKKNYRSIAEKIGAGYFDSVESKDYRRLQIFDLYRNDIRIYRALHKDDMPEDMKKLFTEFDRLVGQYTFIKWMKKNVSDKFMQNDVANLISTEAHQRAERKQHKVDYAVAQEYDRGLTAEQLNGVEVIDRWFVRNWNNGGMSGVGFTNLRIGCADILSELFRRSKRERLHIYYLIETGKRKNPNILDIGESQATYVPDYNNFKKQMLASRWSFIKHTTGSYVYMHKLTEAMDISNRYHDMIMNAARIQIQDESTGKEKSSRKEEQKQGQKQQENGQGAVPAEVLKRDEKLFVFSKMLFKYRDALAAAKKAGQEKQGPLVDAAKSYAVMTQYAFDELKEADAAVEEKLSMKNSLLKDKDPVNLSYDALPEYIKYSGFGIVGLKSGVDNAGKITELSSFTNIFKNLDQSAVKFWTGTVSTSLAAVGAGLTVVLNIYNLVKLCRDMGAGEITSGVLDVLRSLGSVAVSVWTGVESTTGVANQIFLFADGQASVATSSAGIASGAVGAVSFAAGVIKIGVNIHRCGKTGSAVDAITTKRAAKLKEIKETKDKKEAEEKVKELKREARYEDSMIGLSRKLQDKDAIAGGFLATTGLVALGGVAIAAAVASGGLFVLAAGVAISVVGGMVDAVMAGRAQMEAFDRFINLPDIARAVKDKLKEKGKTVNDEKAFMDQLRRKVCASLGFADVASACDQISKNTSGFIYDRLFNPNLSPEEKQPYIDIVKGFGLRYTPGKKSDGSDRKPTLQALQKKFSGR